MFKERFHELLEEKNLNQKEFSRQSGIPYTTITGWTNLNRLPDFSALKKIADYFDISADYLLGREDDYGNITTGTGEKLTLREEELLSYFRQMPDNIKNAVLETAKIMLDSVKEK